MIRIVHPADDSPHPLYAKIVEVARRDLGQGEIGGNNAGPFVEPLMRGKRGPWCAAWGSQKLIEAYKELGLISPLPHRITGAKRAIRAVLRAGGIKLEPEDARAGDIFCLHSKRGRWKGHFGLVEDSDGTGIVQTLEGNVGRAPAVVRDDLFRDLTDPITYLVVRPPILIGAPRS